MRRFWSYCLLLFVLLVGCNSDLHTKKLAAQSLKDQPPVSIVSGFLDLKYTENEAGGFSLFSELGPSIRRPLLTSLQLIATISLCVFIYFLRGKPISTLLPYLIILSGALGNLIDRLRNGYVVDFIHLHFKEQVSWPIFNVADILIAVGVGALLLQAFYHRSRKPEFNATI